PGRSRRESWHPERGSPCSLRVVARCGAQTSNRAHDHPAKRPAVGVLDLGSVVAQTGCPVAAVAVADLAVPSLAAALLRSCQAVDAIVAVADPGDPSLAAVVALRS